MEKNMEIKSEMKGEGKEEVEGSPKMYKRIKPNLERTKSCGG